MFKSTILKCREQESVATIHNGTYTTNLSKPITIEEGDQLQIKSCFLDTTIEDNITVNEDFTAILKTCRYLTNYYTATDNNLTNPFRSTGSDDQMVYTQGPGSAFGAGPDLKKYWACRTVPNNVDNKLLKSMFIQPARANRAYGSTRQIVYWFKILYRDPEYTGAGDAPFIESEPIVVPKTRYDKAPLGINVPVNYWVRIKSGTADGDNVKLAAPWDGTGIFNMKPATTNAQSFSQTQQDNPFLQLITDTCEIPIKAGIYTPTELSAIITEKMSLLQRETKDPGKAVIGNDYALGTFLVNSPFLSSTFQEYYKQFDIGSPGNGVLPDPAVDNETIIYMGEDKQGVFSYWRRAASADKDNLLGTNNASLNYDENLAKLNFDVLHFPVQVPVGGTFVPGVAYNPEVTSFPEGPVTSYSGVGIVSFEPMDFWQQLGFGPQNTVKANQTDEVLLYDAGFALIGSPAVKTQLTPIYNKPAGTGRNLHMLDISTTTGVNQTAQYAGMDLVVNATAVTPENWMIPFANTSGIANSITTPIFGVTQFQGSGVNDGFYLINIGVNMPQEMIGSTEVNSRNSNNLQSIVGKFYTQGNFLQDEGSGSIVYTHVGPPALMSSLDIQILNGDNSIPSNTDLGDNSTIFIEVIKPVPPPVLPEDKDKK